MAALVECVPNFSEGRRPEVIDAIIAAALSENGVALLDKEMDADHNRSVVTLVGSPEAVSAAAIRAVGKAAELIDMRTHEGEHPRMGATDVVPFVPISGIGLPECAALARQVGEKIADAYGIPIFLYESAATRPDRRNLATVRKGEYEALTEAIGTDPARQPDFGPDKMNLKTGATAVGARMPLVAYNVYLDTNRLSVAQAIAKAIRFQTGGLRYCKAMGFDIQDRGCVQVSMNLVNYLKTPVFRVFEMIKSEAARWGARVTSSEIVGLTPAQSLYAVAEHYLQLEQFTPQQVLEERLRTVLAEQNERAGLNLFVENVASSAPAPGGGSVAAAAGTLAAALSAMVCRLTIGKKKYTDARPELETVLARSSALQNRMSVLVEEDTQAFDRIMSARKLPKDTDAEKTARDAAIDEATRGAAAVPLEVMKLAYEALQMAQVCAEKGNVNSVSDAGVAAQMARAAVVGAGLNVKINLTGFPDEAFAADFFRQMRELDEASARLTDEVLRAVHARIDAS